MIKEWIIVQDIYGSEPYECPYCGARVEIQRNKCPYCKELVKVRPYEIDTDADYERITEWFVKLP